MVDVSKQILLCINDKSELEQLSNSLQSDGYSVIAMKETQKILEIINDKEFSILVLDSTLNETSSLEFVKNISLISKAPPICLIAGEKDGGQMQAFIKNGVARYVIRPYEISDVILSISHIIGMQKCSSSEKSTAPLDFLDLELSIPTNLKRAEETIHNLVCKLEETGRYDGTSIQKVNLSLYEALANATEHGNLNDETKKIEIKVMINQDSATFTIVDEGDGFNIDNVPNPMRPENIHLKRGRGIYLMKSFMDEVLYNAKGNSVTIKKFISKAE